MYDAIKLTIITATSALLAYLQPVHNAMLVLFSIFLIDMGIGIATDLMINKNRLSKKKFMFAFKSFMIYAAIIASIYVVGEKMGDLDEALFIDKWITYAFIYFYIANSFNNLRKLFPQRRAIEFLDFVIGLEFMKRIPAIGEFLKYEKEVNEVNEFKETNDEKNIDSINN